MGSQIKNLIGIFLFTGILFGIFGGTQLIAAEAVGAMFTEECKDESYHCISKDGNTPKCEKKDGYGANPNLNQNQIEETCADALKKLEERIAKNDKDKKEKETDCAESSRYGSGRYNCKPTQGLATAAEYSRIGTELVGSQVVNYVASKKMLDLDAGSKQSEYFKSAADTSSTTAKIQAGFAASQATFTTLLARKNRKHKDNLILIDQALNSETLDGYKGEAKTTSQGKVRQGRKGRLDKRGVNSAEAIKLRNEIAASLNCNDTETSCKTQVNAALVRMREQQQNAITLSNQATMASTISTAQQTANTIISADTARQNNKLAKKAQGIEAQENAIQESISAISALEMGNGSPDDPTNEGESGVAGVDDEPANDDDNNGFGAPTNPLSDTELAGAPAPGTFSEGKKEGGSVGGGGGLGGAGGGGAPSAENQEEGKASYAGNFGGKDTYETGRSAAGRAGGGGANLGGDGGIDFNSMLAQFLPKGNEEEPLTNGILEYEGQRSPASAQVQDSFLDKSADIFQRIHQTYQEKQARKQLGR